MTWEGIKSYQELLDEAQTSNKILQENFAKIVLLAEQAIDEIPYKCDHEYCGRQNRRTPMKCHTCDSLDAAKNLLRDIKALADIQDIST